MSSCSSICLEIRLDETCPINKARMIATKEIMKTSVKTCPIILLFLSPNARYTPISYFLSRKNKVISKLKMIIVVKRVPQKIKRETFNIVSIEVIIESKAGDVLEMCQSTGSMASAALEKAAKSRGFSKTKRDSSAKGLSSVCKNTIGLTNINLALVYKA